MNVRFTRVVWHVLIDSLVGSNGTEPDPNSAIVTLGIDPHTYLHTYPHTYPHIPSPFTKTM